MKQQINPLLAYFQGSEVRVTNERHPHYNAVGDVIGGEETIAGYGLKIKRFDTQEHFFVYDKSDIKITKRK